MLLPKLELKYRRKGAWQTGARVQSGAPLKWGWMNPSLGSRASQGPVGMGPQGLRGGGGGDRVFLGLTQGLRGLHRETWACAILLTTSVGCVFAGSRHSSSPRSRCPAVACDHELWVATL